MDLRNYSLVTAAYWVFTITDGALRMIVLLHFHTLGYSPVQIAFLFLLYELCGILTNLFGGWIGSRTGLKATLFAGLAIQITALGTLSLLNPEWAPVLSVTFVMGMQALSGVAKDLTKMSSKSAVKLLVPAGSGNSESLLFKWVAILTGSKNALKGVGFFLGGLLLSLLGFALSLQAMAAAVLLALIVTAIFLRGDMGRSKVKSRFRQLFSKSCEINLLSAARFFLFGCRDIWFVVGLPIFLAEILEWNHESIGGFLAVWVIGYGFVQASAPALFPNKGGMESREGAKGILIWGGVLTVLTASIACAVHFDFYLLWSVMIGLGLFGIVFALNSALHSYLILSYSDSDKISLDVGFYYMANACGRLAGTLLSGLTYLYAGLPGCLWTSAAFALIATVITVWLPRTGACCEVFPKEK